MNLNQILFPKEFLQEMLFYVSLLNRVSPLIDCADAIEICELDKLDYLTDRQARKAFNVYRKYSALLVYWRTV